MKFKENGRKTIISHYLSKLSLQEKTIRYQGKYQITCNQFKTQLTASSTTSPLIPPYPSPTLFLCASAYVSLELLLTCLRWSFKSYEHKTKFSRNFIANHQGTATSGINLITFRDLWTALNFTRHYIPHLHFCSHH